MGIIIVMLVCLVTGIVIGTVINSGGFTHRVIIGNNNRMANNIVGGKISRSYTGNNISIINGEVIVDGVKVDDFGNTNNSINITVNGHVDKIENEVGDIEVHGDSGTIDLDTGDISIDGDVSGSIYLDVGDIDCGNVSGNIKVDTGDINCQ